MKILVISDIHGNLSALDAVINDSQRYSYDAVAVLGDLIDYGMRSNEIIERVSSLNKPVLCNIWGNHENAIMSEEYSHFSSDRGVKSAKYTKEMLSENTKEYLNSLNGKNGLFEFEILGVSFLAIHGNLKDPLWGCVSPNSDFSGYEKYDYVLSGHSHLPHCFSVFYEIDNKEYRNKKRTVFINPGSVGQPRNHNPKAQYAILDTEGDVYILGVDYDIEYEQNLFTDKVDSFYRDRLKKGI